jgi:DNA-binding MarR family transcriptional regulator
VKLGKPSKTRASRAVTSDAEGHDDARDVLDSIRRIVHTLRVSSRAAERDVGISAAQLFVIERLSKSRKPLSIGELAERTLTHQSSVSVVVQKLERQGLVQRVRAEDDQRRVEISLTPTARQLLRKAPEAAQDKIIDAIAIMPASKRKHLADLLSQLASNVGSPGTPAMLFEDGDAAKAASAGRKRRVRS